jgi:hypothetical protein
MTCGNGGSIPEREGRSAEARLKRTIVVILASIAGALLWIEHGQRIVADAPMPTELTTLASARVCPDSENVPYSENCIAFMQGDRVAPAHRWRVNAVEGTAGASLDATGPACPANNENVPYSADCIRFMSGWFWRPNTP